MFADMATKSRAPHLFISEWFKHLGVNDAQIAAKIGVNRETVFRWRKEQWRLNPEKIRQIANTLGIKPEQLWHPPTRESIDNLLDGTDEETRKMVTDVVRRMVRK